MPLKIGIEYIYALLSVIAWSTVFIVVKIVIDESNPILLSMFRFFIASIILLIYVYRRKMLSQLKNIYLDEYKNIVFQGLTGIAGMSSILFYGIKYTSASISSIIMNSNPLIIAVLSYLFLKEKLKSINIAGIIIGYIGIIPILSRGENIFKLFTSKHLFGDILCVIAAILWSLYIINGKRLLERYNPIIVTLAAMTIGTVILIPPLIIFYWKDIYNISMKTFWAMIYLGIFPTGVGFTLWFNALEKLPASKLSIIGYLVPILSLILSVILLGEKINVFILIGFILVVLGLYLSNV